MWKKLYFTDSIAEFRQHQKFQAAYQNFKEWVEENLVVHDQWARSSYTTYP